MERSFWLVSLTHMFMEIYYLIQVALIPVFIREFQLGLLEASLVATVPSLVSIFMNLPVGYVADRVDVNQLLFASMAIEATSAFAISQTNSFWVLVLCVSIMKMCSPLYHITGLSSISRVVTQKKISRSMGIHNALGSFGSAIGLVSLAVFQSIADWRWVYIFWPFPLFIWGIIILKSSQLKITKISSEEKRTVLKRLPLIFSAGFIIFLAAIGLREVGNTGTSTFMTTYLVNTVGLSEVSASLIFGLGPFTGILGSLLGGVLGEKIGAKKVLGFAMVGCIFSLVALAFSSHLFILTFVYILYAFFSNSVWSPINTLVADLTPGNERGLSFSIYFLTEGIIISATPVIAATVISLTSIWIIFPFSIIFIALGLLTLQMVSYRSS
jgi:FSR family fosmidomycin resistance protein-like MFS transporter